MNLSFNFSSANVTLTNLFHGDQALADKMNNFLSENWQLFLDELKKPIHTSFAKVFKDEFNSIFINTPVDDLFFL